MEPGSGKRFATRPAKGALTWVRESCWPAIAASARAWASEASADLQRDLRREVVAVGDPARLQQVVGALLLRLRVGAVGLGHRQAGPRAVVREAVVRVVEHGEDLALADAGPLLAHHAQEARPPRPPPGPARAASGCR